MVSVSPHAKDHPANVFRGERKALGADLFAFKFTVYGAEFTAERIAFRVYIDTKSGKLPRVESYTLWRDEDGDGRVDPKKDQKLSSGVVEGGTVIFSERFKFTAEVSFVVRADFTAISPGTFFVINFDHEKSVVKRGGEPARFHLSTTLKAAEHYESYPAIEVRAIPATSVIVGTQRLTVYIDVAYLRGVEPIWNDVSKVSGWVSDRPLVMSETEGFDVLHRRIILSLGQPKAMALGVHEVPPFTIRYRDTASDDAAVRKVHTDSFRIRKDRAAVESNVSVHKIAMGDPIPYELRVLLDPAYIMPDDYLSEMRVREFRGGFRFWDMRVRVLEGEGARIVEYSGIISYLGVPADEAVLSAEKIPYAKIGDLSREVLYVMAPEIRFPFASVVVGKHFEPVERWRSARKEEQKFFSYSIGDWMVMAPMLASGIIVLFYAGQGMVYVVRRRKTGHISLLGRFRMKRRAIRALRRTRLSTAVLACEVSSAIRDYIGVTARIPGAFAHSARFRAWFAEKYRAESDILGLLSRVERLIIENGYDAEIAFAPGECESLLKALSRIKRAELKTAIGKKVLGVKIRIKMVFGR
ncbi:MAG: hypothetical protein HYW91_02905 [Candidatus Sungbacteria bacterium]|nr:hypothetical protein [Candidatus Sungbacteria bacterium]